jgi:hypothetical protein
MRRAAVVSLLCTTIVSAQALLSPADAERTRRQFALSPGEAPLQCKATPVAPTVNLAFRTEAGYVVHIPRGQYSKPTDGWTVFTAITPEHGKPAYLLAHNSPAQAMNSSPGTDSNFDIPGAYFLGAGHYTVESTVRDGGNLMCRQHWKIDVATAHGDRGIPLALAPNTIEDQAHADLPRSGHPDHAPPSRVTILLDAAAFSRHRTVIVDRDRQRMTRSLTALVEHLAATVSVTAFSLEQQREIFHADAFGAQDLARLNTAIAATPQASIDVNLLRDSRGHVDYLMALIGRVLKATGEGDTVIFLGPTSRYRDGVPKDALPVAAHASFFYVRCENFAPLTSNGAEPYISVPTDFHTASEDYPAIDPVKILNATGDDTAAIGGHPPARVVDPSYGQPDIISKVVTLLNGRNFIVHSAAEMAEAIRKIEGRR